MEILQERSKRILVEFYEALINKKGWGAVAKHVGREYRQHNPAVADGVEGLREVFE
jgi:predicted SnoaL-like aldol condensation-catalyzing enzyme